MPNKKSLFLFTLLFSGLSSFAQSEISRDGEGQKVIKGFLTKEQLASDTAFKWFATNQQGYTPYSAALQTLKAQKDSVQFLVFDALTNKLKKVDDAGGVIMETPDLRQVFGTALQPVQIIDHNNWVYLYDAVQGLYVFDYFGNFKRKMPIEGWQHVLVTSQHIYGIKDGALHRYATSTLMQDQQQLPEAIKACNPISLNTGKLLAVCPGGLQVYGLQ